MQLLTSAFHRAKLLESSRLALRAVTSDKG